MTDFTTIFLWIAGVILTATSGVLGWFVNMLFSKFKEQSDKHVRLEDKMDVFNRESIGRDNDLEDNLNKHKLYSAETFSTKADIKSVRDELIVVLYRIEDKLDRKADKN